MSLKPKKSTRITVSLGGKEYATLSVLADKYDVSLSWLTRKAVLEFLQKYGNDGVQLTLDLPVDIEEHRL